jgi:TPR repeat protein
VALVSKQIKRKPRNGLKSILNNHREAATALGIDHVLVNAILKLSANAKGKGSAMKCLVNGKANKALYLLLLVSVAFLTPMAWASDEFSLSKTEIDELEKLVEAGDMEAHYRLGVYYLHGEDVAENKREAVKLLSKAAEHEHAKAQFFLGVCYDTGKGVTENKSEAVKWFTKAAEQGVVEAQFNLGHCYDRGTGVLENKSEAVKWFRKAAEQGLAEAEYVLGICYNLGKGVTENKSEAVKWFKKAIKQGHVEAKCMLGVCYYFGEGVEENTEEAAKWLLKAEEEGSKLAAKLIEELGISRTDHSLKLDRGVLSKRRAWYGPLRCKTFC